MQLPSLLILSSLFSITSFPYTTATPLNARAIRDSTDDATTLAAINQLLSLFSQSLDNKDFESLRDVFADDAQLGGGGAPPIVGIEDIVEFYTGTFENETLRTLHTVDTVLGANFTETTAASTAYASVYYFGPKIFERGGFLFSNTSAVFREKLSDEYVRDEAGDWRVKFQGLDVLSIEGAASVLRPVPGG
ncbi:MAG: hypothetical protein Q9174_005462 [Haloplaca sp. 1 TL-2023]